MESQPENPEFRNNPENFHPCNKLTKFMIDLIVNIDPFISILRIWCTRLLT